MHQQNLALELEQVMVLALQALAMWVWLQQVFGALSPVAENKIGLEAGRWPWRHASLQVVGFQPEWLSQAQSQSLSSMRHRRRCS